jgi:hypothetical protein
MAESADTTRGRADQGRLSTWVLTRTNRMVLTAGIALTVFAVFVALSTVAPSEMRQVIDRRNALWATFSGMVTALVTAVTLVVMFNQLVLSQELGALGGQRERMEGARSFRKDVEPWLDDDVSPVTPSAFLAALLDAVERLGDELDTTTREGVGAADREVQQFAERVRTDARSVSERLDDAEFGTFDLIFAALSFEYSRKIYEARHLRAEYGDSLQAETDDKLEDLVTVLAFFSPAREHFKTLYFQWELINLSRRMLYAAVPALLVALGMVFYVDISGVTGATLGIDNIVWLVSGAITVALLPVFLFISYVLRIVTVTKETLAMGPFVLQDIDEPDSQE